MNGEGKAEAMLLLELLTDYILNILNTGTPVSFSKEAYDKEKEKETCWEWKKIGQGYFCNALANGKEPSKLFSKFLIGKGVTLVSDKITDKFEN